MPVPLADIDLFEPERYRSGDQHPTWWTLRHQAPVWWHPRGHQTGFWCVTRYGDCERVLKDHRVFSSEGGTILASVGSPDPAGGRTISLMDPPRHTVLRTQAMRSFSHSVVRSRAGRIRAHVRDLVRRIEDGEQDFARLAQRLPMAVSGELMGIPERYWDRLAYWTAAGLVPEDPAYSQGEDVDATLRRAHHEIFACLLEVIQFARAHPGDDLVSALVRLAPDGRPMDDRTLMMNCYSFMAGANSTTPYVASHTLLALIERPAVWHQLAEDPGLIGALVEEGARWTSTPHHLVRRALTEVELGGVRIPAGDWVAAWLPSANRDEAIFADPYTFSLARGANPHLGFGAGPHYCIGAPLSRLALSMLFEELVTRFERIELAAPPRHLYSNWINGLTSMPIAVSPWRPAGPPERHPVNAMEDARANDHS
jgi:cytochrome P450